MTSRERFRRMYEHREADRVPIIDIPWAGTIARWKREGMPADAQWPEFFGTDLTASVNVDITPQYEQQILEETERYVIKTTSWGVTLKQLKQEDSTPEFLDYKVKTPAAWEEAKARMAPSRERINWKNLEQNYERWLAEGRWIQGGFWFGFDVTHSWMSGTETVLVAMLEQPDWVKDMFETYLDCCIAHFDMIWDAGYRVDTICWPDDMGYKGSAFFSNEIYRELLQPVQKRAVDWAHSKGIYTHLHSCGNIMKLLPDILETGVDALNPIEIKAGMDVLGIKRSYGDRLVLHGGLNAVLWDNKEAILEEIRRLVPLLKENGGYIFSSDHSIPNSVSLETFRSIVEEVKRCGAY